MITLRYHAPIRFLYTFAGIAGLLILSSCQSPSSENEQSGQETAQQSSQDTSKKLYPEPEDQNARGALTRSNKDSNELIIGYVSWTEGIAMTHVVAEILQDRMALDVKKRKGYVGQVLDSLAMGTHDIFLDHWLAADSSMGEMSDFTDLGINYRDARIGLVVPEYMDLSSIEELSDYQGTDNQIIGIDEGSDVMRKTKAVLQAYDIDYDLVIGSGPAMVHQLQKRIRDQKPIIVTGWRPHWKFGRFDLKFLDDPKKVYGASKNIHTLARKGLTGDHPQVVAFLRNFKMNTGQLANLMEVFARANDWDKAAEQWCENHPELIESWMPEEPA